MNERIMIAHWAAGISVKVWLGATAMQVLDASCWPCIGGVIVHPDGQPVEDLERCNEALTPVLEQLAAFVRGNPEAPLEALYRHAGGREIHQRPADGFDDIEPAFRIAYAVFRSTLLEADRVFAEEEARAAAKARAEAVQPPVIVPLEDTILARHGSIFDRIGDRPETVNLGGPVVAASEGEGGDATVDMAEPAGGGADQGDVGAAAAADTGPSAGAHGAVLPGGDQSGETAAGGAAQGDAGAAASADDAGATEGLAGATEQPAAGERLAGDAAADAAAEAPVKPPKK